MKGDWLEGECSGGPVAQAGCVSGSSFQNCRRIAASI